MFKRKPDYTSEDINDAVKRIERLTVLHDKAEQMVRLTKESRYQQIYDGLTRNILSAQATLDFIQEKVRK